MYLKKSANGDKDIMVVKHLEDRFFQALTKKQMKMIKARFLIGLYLGTQIEQINYKIYDFIIFVDGVFPSFKNDIPRLPMSGFNFLPPTEGAYNKCLASDVVYIGDLSVNKNLKEFLKFSEIHTTLKCKAVMRVLYISDFIILGLLKIFFSNVEFVIPSARKKSHKRETIFSHIASADYVFIPYLKEGAARVFAEAELLGKPLIYNPKMLGGTQCFMDPMENISIDEFATNKIFRVKDMDAKQKIYLAGCTSRSVEQFFSKTFQIDVVFDDAELVNAFSGHKNLIPKKLSNANTDEISTFRSFAYFLDSIGCDRPALGIGTIKQYIYDKLRGVYKILNLFSYWSNFLLSVIDRKRLR